MEAAEIYLRRTAGRVHSYKFCVSEADIITSKAISRQLLTYGVRVHSQNSATEKCVCQPVTGIRFSLRSSVSFRSVIIQAMPRIHHLSSSPYHHHPYISIFCEMLS